MKLTNDQITILIDKFISSEDAKVWIKQRQNDNKRWKEWIDPDKPNFPFFTT